MDRLCILWEYQLEDNVSNVGLEEIRTILRAFTGSDVLSDEAESVSTKFSLELKEKKLTKPNDALGGVPSCLAIGHQLP